MRKGDFMDTFILADHVLGFAYFSGGYSYARENNQRE